MAAAYIPFPEGDLLIHVIIIASGVNSYNCH